MGWICFVVSTAIKTVFVLILALGLLFGVNYYDARANPVTRAALHVDQPPPANDLCVERPLPNFWRPLVPELREGREDLSYNSERVGNEFAQFGAMSANGYALESDASFQFSSELGWTRIEPRYDRQGGLSVDVYRKDEAERVLIAVVFRGTRGP